MASSQAQTLHLHPRSTLGQRIWNVGCPRSAAIDATGLTLRVCPDNHESFASLITILDQLRPFANQDQIRQLQALQNYLVEVCPDPKVRNGGSHGQLLADSVAFAVMRRISRESFYTARVIELGARTINTIISQMPEYKYACVSNVDRLDRPTLKVLARAMLLLEVHHGFSWVWHSTSDPTAEIASASEMFLDSRQELMRQLFAILSPTLIHNEGIRPLSQPDGRFPARSAYDVATALVLQNYDACFLWSESLLKSDDVGCVTEGLRLRALAAVNIGAFEDALKMLRLAEDESVSPGRRAHLSYIQGLIETKRKYDLSTSTSHYLRGLAALDGANDGNEDLALERAWLLNGIALNEAVLWRRNPTEQGHHAEAFAREREAFSLVLEGDTAARTYLRFNLLANSAFLLEMQGAYDLAIDTLMKTFDFELDESKLKRQTWQSALGYRLGVLHYRAGRKEKALQILQEAAEQDEQPENWPTQERILRALGAVLIGLGRFSEAAQTFASGLQMCREGRARHGTVEHARGLIFSLLQQSKTQRALDICEELEADEKLAAFPIGNEASTLSSEGIRPAYPSPKLPAYFPELDLEGMPSVDLNRFLGIAANASG